MACSYEVDTRVDKPHGDQVTDLAYHPVDDLLVTSSLDGTFKVWARVHSGTANRYPPVSSMTLSRSRLLTCLPRPLFCAVNVMRAPWVCGLMCSAASWICRSVGFYKRQKQATSCAFSSDGSLLAVSFGGVVALWDSYTNNLLGSLENPGSSEDIRYGFRGSPPLHCALAVP